MFNRISSCFQYPLINSSVSTTIAVAAIAFAATMIDYLSTSLVRQSDQPRQREEAILTIAAAEESAVPQDVCEGPPTVPVVALVELCGRQNRLVFGDIDQLAAVVHMSAGHEAGNGLPAQKSQYHVLQSTRTSPSTNGREPRLQGSA